MNDLLLRRVMMRDREPTIRAVFHPSSYDSENSSFKSISTTYPIANAYTSADSDSFGRVFINTGQGSETTLYFLFDISSLPSDAIIHSVVLKTRATIQTIQSTAISTRTQQVCVGTNIRGATSVVNTSDTIRSLDTGGSWTLSDLQDISLYFNFVRGTTSTATNFQLDVYGADLIIEYSLPMT